MRTAATSFSLSIDNVELQVTEVYEIALTEGTTYYYTSHNSSITWGSNTYESIPISRNPLQGHLSGEHDIQDIALANISGDLADKA